MTGPHFCPILLARGRSLNAAHAWGRGPQRRIHRVGIVGGHLKGCLRSQQTGMYFTQWHVWGKVNKTGHEVSGRVLMFHVK